MGDSHTFFIQLAIVLGLASSLGYLVKTFKLPLLVAYLLAGVALSIFHIFNLETISAISFLPDIGIAFVLFFVGMELDLKEIKSLGKPVAIASLGQILLSLLAGSLIATLLGFPASESFYLGMGLAFSSTIVVVKLLLEKKEMNSLYGKLSVGILLLEDLIAILLLMVMTVGSSMMNLGLQTSLPLISLIIKGAFLLILSLGLSRFVLARLFTAVAKSSELLFLTALAWCFIFVALSLLLGFSVVIGAFLAGVALANSPFHVEIQGKVKPLRDFFVMLFFVYLGTQVAFDQLGTVWPLIIIFTLYALVVKPIIFLLFLGLFGFKKHTLFKTALHLSQISEFSLIVAMVGLKLGVVSQGALTALALTGVISIIVSSIVITSARKLYPRLSSFVGLFEHSKVVHQAENQPKEMEMENHVILIGGHRIGGEIIKFLKRESIPFLVMDFNPKVIQKLIAERIHALYGDVGDPDVLEFLDLEKARLIISTAQDVDDNLLLLSEIRKKKSKAVIVIRATSTAEASLLYDAGADYVIMPEIVSGDFVAHVLKNYWPNLDFFKDRADIELGKLSRNQLAFV